MNRIYDEAMAKIWSVSKSPARKPTSFSLAQTRHLGIILVGVGILVSVFSVDYIIKLDLHLQILLIVTFLLIQAIGFGLLYSLHYFWLGRLLPFYNPPMEGNQTDFLERIAWTTPQSHELVSSFLSVSPTLGLQGYLRLSLASRRTEALEFQLERKYSFKRVTPYRFQDRGLIIDTIQKKISTEKLRHEIAEATPAVDSVVSSRRL